MGRLAVAGQGVVGERIGANPPAVDQQFAVHVRQRACGVVMADDKVPAALGTGRRAQGNQALLPADHAVPRYAQVRSNVVAVAHVEAHAVDIDVGTPCVGDGEMDVAQIAAVQPGHLAARGNPSCRAPEIVLLRRPPPVVARQVQDVDLLEVGGKVAVHQGVQLADCQAILELVAIVGPLARAMNLAAGVIAVGQDPKDGNANLGASVSWHHSTTVST